jgi:hypothetical protein
MRKPDLSSCFDAIVNTRLDVYTLRVDANDMVIAELTTLLDASDMSFKILHERLLTTVPGAYGPGDRHER